MVGNGIRDGGTRTGFPHDGDVAGGQQFQSFGADEEEGGASVGDAWGLRRSEASELFWVLVVGVGHAGGAGELGLFGGVCGCAVAVF